MTTGRRSDVWVTYFRCITCVVTTLQLSAFLDVIKCDCDKINDFFLFFNWIVSDKHTKRKFKKKKLINFKQQSPRDTNIKTERPRRRDGLTDWMNNLKQQRWLISRLLSSSSTSAYSLRLLQCISSFRLIYMNCKRHLHIWGEAQRETDRQTDRDRQIDREADRQRQTDRQRGRDRET